MRVAAFLFWKMLAKKFTLQLHCCFTDLSLFKGRKWSSPHQYSMSKLKYPDTYFSRMQQWLISFDRRYLLAFTDSASNESHHLMQNDTIKEWKQGGVVRFYQIISIFTSTPPALYPGNRCHSDRVLGQLTRTTGRICRSQMLTYWEVIIQSF